MKGKKLLATLAVSVVLFSGCGIKSAQTIIKVNDTKITQAQYDEIFNKEAQAGMLGAMHIDIKDPKNVFVYNLVRSRVVNELVVKALLNEEAAKRGIKVTDEDMKNAIRVIVDKVGSKEQLDKILKQNGISASEFKKDLKEQVKMKKLADSLGSVNVSDSEVKAFYNKNIDKFKHPEQVRASHILISVNPAELEEIVKSDAKNKGLSDAEIKAKVGEQIKAKEVKAKEIFAKAQQNPDSFAQLAKENSDDTVSGEKGGDLGFFSKEEMVPEFAQAAFSAKTNSVVGPVKTQYGYHIIIVKDRKAAGQDSFEKVKNNIREYLANEKQLEKVDNLLESLKKTAKIEYINKDLDPERIQQEVEKNIQESASMVPDGVKEELNKQQQK